MRTLTLAAVAALTVTSANAASMTVTLTGKSPAQVKAEIAAAARKVCLRESGGPLYPSDALAACIKDAKTPAMVEAEAKMETMAKVKAPEVLARN